MNQVKIDLENHIQLHCINEDKFKSDCVAIFLTIPLERQTVTLNALLTNVLRRGTERLHTTKEIETELEEMYGAILSVSVDKVGGNHVLKFILQSVRDDIVKENVLEKNIQNITDIILRPYLVNGLFNSEYFEQEKQALEIEIKDKINDKRAYSLSRAIEEIYNKEGYGIYQNGYAEDLKQINNAQLYNQYINVLQTAKIDIYTYTNEDENVIKEYISKYFVSDILNNRKNEYVPRKANAHRKDENVVKENMDVTQGKLVLAVRLPADEFTDAEISIFNAVLGVGCNSRMFRNIREREHLAYTASSMYIKYSNVILIYAGIELKNFEKTIDLIKKELLDLAKGNISKKELEEAKQTLVSANLSIVDAQYNLIYYYFVNEMFGDIEVPEETRKKLQDVKMAKVVQIAKKIEINTIYCLTKEDK